MIVRGHERTPRNAHLFLTLARLGNVVRRLPTHQGIHLDPGGLLYSERHFPGETGLAIEQTGQGRPRDMELRLRTEARTWPEGHLRNGLRRRIGAKPGL
jgi:hypothetical protein